MGTQLQIYPTLHIYDIPIYSVYIKIINSIMYIYMYTCISIFLKIFLI